MPDSTHPVTKEHAPSTTGTERSTARRTSSSERRAAINVAERRNREVDVEGKRQILTAGGKKGPLSGAQWDQYDIGDLLGEGGMAAVYLARRHADGRVIALKVLPGHLAGDAGSRNRFLLEARTARSLRSPHIVQVYKVDNYSNLMFFEMELIEGQTLSEVIKDHQERQSQLSPMEAADYALQVAKGLCEAARNQLVHRDIKPANLMLTHEGTVKISDFGIVKVLDEEALTMTGIALGTPAYMSPEQGRADSVDQRADIYSLGVVLYELLTGTQPFTGSTSDALIYQHNFAEPVRISDIRDDLPPGIEAVCFKCLQKRPEKRYQTPDELVDDLELVISGERPTLATFPGNKITCGADEMLAAHGLNRRWWPVALSVCLVVLLLGGGFWWWADRQQTANALRGRLASLDQPTAIPESARAALGRLSDLVGEDDPEVARWQGKLDRVVALEPALEVMHQAEEPDHAVIATAREQVEELRGLVGDDAPLVSQTQRRLDTIDRRIADARSNLQVLDGVTVAPEPMQARLATPLAFLARVLPPDDRPLTSWQDKLSHSRAVITDLRQRLERLDQEPVLNLAEQRDLAPALARLGELSDPADTRIQAWRERLERERQQVSKLTRALQRLEQGDYAPRFLIAELEDELAAFASRAGEVHPDLRRWRARIAASESHLEELHDQLSALDVERVTLGTVIELEGELETWSRLVASDDPDLRRWRRMETVIRERAAALRAILDRLEDRERLKAEERALLHDTMAEAYDLGLLDEAQRERFRRLLARQEAALVILRKRLSVLDNHQDFDPELLDDLRRYEALVDSEDADAARWRTKTDHVMDLKQRLAVLDQAQPLPAEAEELLERLAQAIGPESGRVPTWRAKLHRVTGLKRRLAVIDEAAPLPAKAEQQLATLIEEVGELDPEVVRWRRTLDEIADLRHRFADLDQRLILPSWAPQAAERLAGLLGDDPFVQDVQRRLTELDPPTPDWSASGGRDRFGPFAVLDLDGVALRFRYVPPGTVTIGSPVGEAGREGDEERVRVTLSRGLWLAETECTQAMWQAIMGTRPSYSTGVDHPVERVSWHQAQDFMKALGERAGGIPARLPSEAEWEHACRAGSHGAQPPSPLSTEAELARIAVYDQRAVASSEAVGSRHPNQLGLHDMLGNVWEWCADSYGPYPRRPVVDWMLDRGGDRVVRGASWCDAAGTVRSANRMRLDPDVRSAYVGFRVAIALEAETAP